MTRNQKLDGALWEFRTAFKVATRATPFKLSYGLEAIVLMEFVVLSLRIASINKLSAKESMLDRLKKLLKLEEGMLQAAYQLEILQKR